MKPRKFRNKYRVDSTRKPNWDYRRPGVYYITLVTKNRIHFFGSIVKRIPNSDNEMHLSELGKLADKFWQEIPLHFPFVELGNFVIMPDHMHGMLIIKNNPEIKSNITVSKEEETSFNSNVFEPNFESIQRAYTCSIRENMASISPKYGSISTVVRSYKSVVSKFAHMINPDFDWHSNYHDYVVLSRNAYDNMQRYTLNNPKNWGRRRT
ncbi:transposase [Aquirufa nivalisilvae]|uniref:transposase n=1 Tax=Aquirufa nivalisilvae TaxID=2516557 RepID=UPI0022A90CD9|nr:transposase [Aquirufa nivalisilvae]MCZ2480837.1 transposase [Aquirufa nivalisilvae]MCZ2482153.1 transposase [Aquirufa nivalisilvae]